MCDVVITVVCYNVLNKISLLLSYLARRDFYFPAVKWRKDMYLCVCAFPESCPIRNFVFHGGISKLFGTKLMIIMTVNVSCASHAIGLKVKVTLCM